MRNSMRGNIAKNVCCRRQTYTRDQLFGHRRDFFVECGKDAPATRLLNDNDRTAPSLGSPVHDPGIDDAHQRRIVDAL